MSKFKVDDWVFYEFELNQIQKMIGNKITEVSTGAVRGYSTDFSDRVLPLTTTNKLIAETYQRQYERLRENCSCANLNWPDIHGWFVDHWLETCRQQPNSATEKQSAEDYFHKRYAELYDFVEQATLSCEPLLLARVKGVKLVRT